MTIQQIGYVVGYNTPAYFIRQFKAKYGYTPNEYRRIYGTPHSNDV
jgi:AraC-like DNA-binding protein